MDRLADIHGDRRLVEEAGGAGGPDAAAGSTLTYRQAAARVAAMSGAIGARSEPGDRVVLALPNSYDLLLASLAACRAGAIAVPVNAELTAAEVDLVAHDAGAAMVVRSAEELGGTPAPPAVEGDPGQVAAVFYTSGTTGRPKGARLTHRSLLGQVSAGVLWPAGLRRDEAVIALPLSHIMGFVATLALAVSGVPVYFLPRFRPDAVLDAIEGRRATLFIGVPAMYRLMLEAGAEQRDLHSVRVWASGADAMPAELARRFQAMGAIATLPVLGTNVGQAAFVEGYGMVEAAGGVAIKLSPPLVPLMPGDSVGFPVPPNRMRVVDEEGNDVAGGEVGELWVKGPGLLEGYHGDPEGTEAVRTADGWLRTGDLARRGPFGLIHFAGRSKDVIKRGGYSVYAVEVEGALEEHPDVVEAAVVGLPDERLGEIPVAAVRLSRGASLTEDELTAWAAERLAAFKVPARIRFVEDLPHTGTSKVRREEVRALLLEGDD
ncbi:MAG TPA: AMP-binding protein [Acidimicrobiales bacterium]|nr:AMP-binding protein [Acidimicrobiales bacterium]